MADWTDIDEKDIPKPKAKSVWGRFKDSYLEGALHNPIGAEGAMRYLGIGRPKGVSDEELNRAERRMSDDLARSRAADDEAWKDVDALSPANIGRKAVELVGGMLGGVDPTYVLGPGRTAGQRIAAQAAINADADVVGQVIEKKRGVRDELDGWQTLTNAAAGALFQGGGEVVSKGRLGRKIKAGSAHPDFGKIVDITIHSESRGNDNAVSRVGAKGKMQVMPGTLRDPGFGIRKSNGTKADDARVGRQYLAVMMDRYDGDMQKVWAAYNWGPGNLDKAVKNHGGDWLGHAPKETRAYVAQNTRMLGGRNVNVDDAIGNKIEGTQTAENFNNWENRRSDAFPENDNGLGEIANNANDTNGADIDAAFKEWEAAEEHYNRVHRYPEVEPDIVNMRQHDADWSAMKRAEASYLRLKGDEDGALKAERDIHPDELSPKDRERIWGRISAENENHVDMSLEEMIDSGLPLFGKDPNMVPANTGKPVTRDQFAPIRDPANDMGGEPVSSAVKPDMGNARGGNDNVPAPVLKQHFEKVLAHRTEALNLLTSGKKIDIGREQFETELLETRNMINEANRTPEYKQHVPILKKIHAVWEAVGRKLGFDTNLEKAKDNVLGITKTIKDIFNDEDGSFRPFGRDKGPEGPDGEGPETPKSADEPVVKKIMAAIEATIPLRKDQKKLYRDERERRTAKLAGVSKVAKGEAGHFAETAQLKGQFPKVHFESIRDLFSQDEIDRLFDIVREVPHFSVYDKVTAHEGLLKIFNAEHGVVPTDGELRLLGEAFPKEMIDGLMKHRTLAKKIGEGIANALNLPRSIMASFDLSAPLRQGVTLIGRKEFWTAFAGMFKQFGSEKAHRAVMDEITSRPTYRQMRKAGLSLTGTGKVLTEREEAFMSEWAERIPVIGRGIRASNRAYTGFLNKLRADTFDSLYKNAREAGIDFTQNPKALKDLGKFLNAATGRGDLGKLNAAAPLLNGVFFSPRLMASRLQMLNPMFYARLDPMVRKEAIKSVMAFGAIATTVLGLAAMGGAEVETDPRSSDFAKIKVGKTRYDILGGYQQYIKLGAQLATGETKNATSGVVTDLTAGKYGQQTRLSVLGKFLMSKESPIASFVTDMLEGKDQLGRPITLTDEVIQRVTPLLFQDTYDAYMEYGAKGLLVGLPGMFGIGINTYRDSDKIKARAKTKPKNDDWADIDSPGSEPKEDDMWKNIS